ncbi:HAD family phosphatase [Pendulispora brunnea]|uniref:HAD family phosphatase n=1 Tax=Pendulispora brunnea TaxID=2905690 RepID=A0ABZ2JW28_9BACT
MPQAIVFDLFGVIALHQSAEDKQRLERLAGAPPRTFWESYWALRKPYDAGQTSVDYWATMGRRLGVNYDAATVKALIDADLASWTGVDPTMVDLLGDLSAAGRKLGLLSNIIEDLVPVFEAKHGSWLSRFHARTYSCQIGVAKPDHDAYRIAAARLGVEPRDCIFIDDNENNVRAARETGMQAEVFTSPAQVRRLLAA